MDTLKNNRSHKYAWDNTFEIAFNIYTIIKTINKPSIVYDLLNKKTLVWKLPWTQNVNLTYVRRSEDVQDLNTGKLIYP